MLIMPLFGNVFYESGRLKSLPGKGTGKFSGLADVAACIAAPVEFPLVLGSVPKAVRRGRPSSRSRQIRDTRPSGCYGRDKDGSYRDKRLDNSGCGGVFFSSGGPGDFRRARRMLATEAGEPARPVPRWRDGRVRGGGGEPGWPRY